MYEGMIQKSLNYSYTGAWGGWLSLASKDAPPSVVLYIYKG